MNVTCPDRLRSGPSFLAPSFQKERSRSQLIRMMWVLVGAGAVEAGLVMGERVLVEDCGGERAAWRKRRTSQLEEAPRVDVRRVRDEGGSER